VGLEDGIDSAEMVRIMKVYNPLACLLSGMCSLVIGFFLLFRPHEVQKWNLKEDDEFSTRWPVGRLLGRLFRSGHEGPGYIWLLRFFGVIFSIVGLLLIGSVIWDWLA
jgi:hypothetical protein